MSSTTFASRWNKMNDPRLFNFVLKQTELIRFDFYSLPLAAKLQDERLGWSETFWPSNKGGIAYRWNSPNPMPFKYKLKTKAELMRMSEAELSELSPAELYDIAQGDYSYKLTKAVLASYKKEDLWWEGICHGWALAASNYPEPAKVVVTNKDGIQVPFGSSDVKGLLAMHDAFNSAGKYARVGGRCAVYGKVEGEAFPEDGMMPVPSKEDASVPDCEDVNAGTFHIVLTNMIGLYSTGIIADVDRFNDVWNQPVTSYESEVVQEISASISEIRKGIDRKIHVKTKMVYGDELEFYTAEEASKGTLGFVSKDPVTGTSAQTFGDKHYEYILELDNAGKIIGGEWISESRPDFIWSKTKDKTFNDKNISKNPFKRIYPLSGLTRIYKPVKR